MLNSPHSVSSCLSLTKSGHNHNKPLRKGKLNRMTTIARKESKLGRVFPQCCPTRSKQKALIYLCAPHNEPQRFFKFTPDSPANVALNGLFIKKENSDCLLIVADSSG